MSEMTSRPLDLDASLEGWLRDGPRLSADRVVASALTDVGATRQDRVSLFAIDATVLRLGFVAATLAALVIGLGPRLIATDPSPTPSAGESIRPAATATPDASRPPSGLIVYTNEEDGYELTLPASWTPAEFFSDPPGTMRFGGAHSDSGPSSYGALTVSIGNVDGTVYDCAPSACRQVVASTIEELAAAIPSDLYASDNASIDRTDMDVSLDGVPARLEYVTFSGGLIEAGPQFHHLFAIHDGRPIVLSFDKYAYGLGQESNNIEWVLGLIRRFHFLDRETTWERVTLNGLGLTMDAPPSWQVTTVLPHRTIVAGPEGSISVVHDKTGELFLCPPIGPCASHEVESVDDLVSFVAREYRLDFGLSEVETTQKPVDLGAGEARRVSVSPGGDFLLPAARGAIVVLLESQSLVIRWSGSLNPPSPLEEILSSLRMGE